MANQGREYDKRAGKGPMYEEIIESTHSRALYVQPPCRNEVEQEILKASNSKHLIEEVLEKKQVMMVLKETPTKGFPLFEECQRQPVQLGFKLP